MFADTADDEAPSHTVPGTQIQEVKAHSMSMKPWILFKESHRRASKGLRAGSCSSLDLHLQHLCRTKSS